MSTGKAGSGSQMILIELALQGIQGFPPLSRLAFKPGVNVLRSADAGLRRTFVDAIYHALYPDPARGSATEKLVDKTSKESRILLSFYGRDKATYRIVREAANGAMSLHKLESETNKFNAISRTAQEVAQYVRVQQQLPDEVGYERLFVFSAESMPSKGARARTRSGAPIAQGLGAVAPSGPGLPAARSGSALGRAPSGIRGHSSPGLSSLAQSNAIVQAELSGDLPGSEDEVPENSLEGKKAQLEKLKEELQHAARSEEAQARVDALNARKGALLQLVERVRGLRGEVEKLRSMVAANRELQSLPAGFGERLKRLDEVNAKFQSDRNKLSDEYAEIEALIHNTPVVRLQEDRYFVAGVAFALLSFAAAILIEQPRLALVNMLGAVVAATAALRYIGDLEKAARLESRRVAVEERQTRLIRQYESDTSAMRKLMEKLEISEAQELLERIEGAEQMQKQLRASEEALAEHLANPDAANAEQEVAALSKQVEKMEAEILGATTSASVETLERRIYDLEREIAKREGRPVPPRAPSLRSKSAITAITESNQSLKFPTGDLPRLSTGDIPRVLTTGSYNVPDLRTSSAVMSGPEEGTSPPRATSSSSPAPTAVMRTGSNPVMRTGSNPVVRAPELAPTVIRPAMARPHTPADAGALQTGSHPTAAPRAPSNVRVQNLQVSQPTVPAMPAPVPRTPSNVKPPNSEAASLFDFGGGNIGSDDDDEEEGYGSGYDGPPRGPAGGASVSGGREDGLVWLAAGGFSSPRGGSGVHGNYGGGGELGGEPGPPPDRSRDLMQAVVDLMQVPVDELSQKISARLGQYLHAFTDGQWTRPEFGSKGELSLYEKGNETALPYVELKPEDVDLVDSALRFTLMEVCLSKLRIPILIDDPFGHFPPQRRALLAQMIAYLGRATQVVFLSDKNDVPGHEITG